MGVGSGGGVVAASSRSSLADVGSGVSGQGMQESQGSFSLVARARVQKKGHELLFLDCVVRGDGEGLCMPPRRFSSWGLLGIPGGLRMSDASLDASLGLPLTKPVCVVPREVALWGWKHLHSSVETTDPDPHPPLLPSQAALCSGQGPRLCGGFSFE